MPTNPTQDPETSYDVVIVGGGAAGLSAGLILARSRRTVLVVDAGQPRNAPAEGVHGFLSRDGTDPQALLATGRDEVRRYGGRILDGEALAAHGTAGRFTVELRDGQTIGARRLLVATGLTDELPDLPGLRKRWGRDVVHCPFCHGWEHRDQAIAVLSTSSATIHQALLFRQLSSHVTVLTHTGPALSDGQVGELTARDIAIVGGPVAALELDDDTLVGALLADRTVVPCQALVVRPRFVAASPVLASLGLRPTPVGPDDDEAFPAGPGGVTEIPGVWVAGNVADVMLGVMGSAAAGYAAGVAIHADLIATQTIAPNPGRRTSDGEQP